jgi:hypothetical protein
MLVYFVGIRLNFITVADQTKFEDLFKRATASSGGKQITGKFIFFVFQLDAVAHHDFLS